jgi:hypothetical protein
VRVRDGRERALVVPLDQVVVRLKHGELGQPELALQFERRGEPLRRVVGGRDVPDHALFDERVEGAQRLLERRLGVVPVPVIQVDVVGLQPLKRGVRLAADGVGPQVAVPRVATAADLRGEHDLVAVAAVLQPAPEDRLRPAMLDQIGVRGIDEVAARRRVGVEDLARLLLVGGPAEHVAAQADGIDIQLRTAKGNHAANLSIPVVSYRHRWITGGPPAGGTHHEPHEHHRSQVKISQLTDVLHRNLQKHLCCNERSECADRPGARTFPAGSRAAIHSSYRLTEGTALLKEPHERDCDGSSGRPAALPLPREGAGGQRQHAYRGWRHRSVRRAARAHVGDAPCSLPVLLRDRPACRAGPRC